MPGSRHRRDVTRRTLVIGAVLATSLGAGVLALGLATGSGFRVAMMFVLLIAVAAGLLALDEARLVEARLMAEASRDRASRAREASAEADTQIALRRRIDSLEADLAALRRELMRAPRTVVVVAPDRREAPRIIELRDVVPASDSGLSHEESFDLATDRVSVAPADRPQQPVALDDAATQGEDAVIDLTSDDFPVTEVIGEFSLEGLSVFPRPAGMPTFPSVDEAWTAEPDTFPVDAPAPTIVDLRDRDRSRGTRSA